MMEFKPRQTIIRTGGGSDLAFTLVVMVSYLATFSTLQPESNLQIVLMIALGIAYLTNGIYGYAYASMSASLVIQLGYFLIQVVLGSLIIYLGKGSGLNVMLLLPLAGQSAVLLPQYWMVVTNVVILAGYITPVNSFTPDWNDIWLGLQTFLAGQIFIIFFTQMAINEEQSRHEVERLVADLAAANQRLREYALQVEELAISKERNRLAREIHDGLGHFLTTIHMQIQAARAIQARDPQKARSALENAQKLTQEALEDVRRSVSALRFPAGESLPLPERVAALLNSSEVSGLVPKLDVVGTPRLLSPQAELTLFRAVQEGLNNTCKHAHASRVWVELDYSDPGRVRLKIQDDGVGRDGDTTSGFGLLGLQERANLLNGSFKVTSSPGKGFIIELEVPEKNHAHQPSAG